MSLLDDSISLYKREMLIFRANFRTNLIRASIFPIVIIVLFGLLGNSVSNVPIAVVNYANNAESVQFISSLSQQNLMTVQTVTTESQALSLLDSGQIYFVIVVLPNFPSKTSQPAIQVYYTNTQYTVTSEVLPIIQERAAVFTSSVSLQSRLYSPSSGSSVVVTTPVSSATGSYKNFLFSGVIGMVLVFSALFGGGISIITDRTGGYIKAFLATPINKTSILLGRVFAGMVQSFLYVTIVLIIGIANGSNIAMGAVGLVWIYFIGILVMVCFTSLAAIIASRMKNIQAYAIISQTVGLPLWLLSGGIFPISSLPSILRPISVIDPLTYATDAFRWVILQGTFPLPSMVTDISVLVIFAAVSTYLSIRLFKSTID